MRRPPPPPDMDLIEPRAPTSTPKPAPPKSRGHEYRAPWPDADVAVAVAMRRRGASYAEVGRALGRTGESVRQRMRTMRQPVRATLWRRLWAALLGR